MMVTNETPGLCLTAFIASDVRAFEKDYPAYMKKENRQTFCPDGGWLHQEEGLMIIEQKGGAV